MKVLTDPPETDDRTSKHISLYFVDFAHLDSQRVPNGFERELQRRLVHHDEHHIDFKRLLEVLKPRDRHLVEAYCMGYTQEELAERFGITQQLVSRRLRKAGRRLKRMIRGLPWRGEEPIVYRKGQKINTETSREKEERTCQPTE